MSVTLAVAAAATPDADAARAQAREILSQRRYSPPPLPDPLRGPLNAIESVLRSIGRAIQSVLDTVSRALPGGEPVALALLGLAVVMLVAGLVVVARLVRRPTKTPAASGVDTGEQPPLDAAQLELAAEQAERAGDAAAAVRIRFQAGLLRLSERDVIGMRVSLPSGEVGRRLRSRTFDTLARRFDEIVYGGLPAAGEDARAARDGWRRVLAEIDAR